MRNLPRIYRFVALVLIFNIVFAAKCSGIMSSAKESRTRKIIVAADDFAEGQKSVARLLATAKATNLVSGEDIEELKPFLLQANGLNAKAIEYGKKLIQNPPDPETERNLIDTINQISAVLIRANNIGFLRIKDLKTREAFSLLIITMQNAATSVIIALKEN